VLGAAAAGAFDVETCDDTRCKNMKTRAKNAQTSAHIKQCAQASAQHRTLKGSHEVSGLALGITPEGVTSTMQLKTADSGPERESKGKRRKHRSAERTCLRATNGP
jgi:hypothetical protein